MERATHPAIEHLKEVAWGVFMIDLILALLGLFFWYHFGTTLTLWIFGTLAALVTLAVGGIAVLNVLLVWLYERWERARGRRRA